MSIVRHVVSVVTACMTRQGTPTFVRTEVAVSKDELENGVNYALAESKLFVDGYEEPFVHFAEDEAPEFLLPAVRQLESIASPPVLSEAC